MIFIDQSPFLSAFSTKSTNDLQLAGVHWPLGITVTLKVYHNYPGDPDYSSNSKEVTNLVPEDTTNPIVEINFTKEAFSILPGDTVEMADGTVTKTVVVSLLQFTKERRKTPGFRNGNIKRNL